jgi:hypothetical protein
MYFRYPDPRVPPGINVWDLQAKLYALTTQLEFQAFRRKLLVEQERDIESQIGDVLSELTRVRDSGRPLEACKDDALKPVRNPFASLWRSSHGSDDGGHYSKPSRS